MFNLYQVTFPQHHLSVVETFRLLISHNSNIVWLHPFYEAYKTEIFVNFVINLSHLGHILCQRLIQESSPDLRT